MTSLLKSGMQPVAIGLSLLLAFPILQGQTLPTQLSIVVLRGEGATYNTSQRVTGQPAVRIEDENHAPITGAAVVFTLPTEGATAEFSNKSKNLTVITDKQGLAAVQSLRLNGLPGKIPIQVNASYRGLTARTTINELSALAPGAKPSAGGGHGTLIAVVVVLAAAAAGGGAYFATHGSGSTATTVTTPSGPTPIGVTPGTGTITGGH